jgi:hypothetical protein
MMEKVLSLADDVKVEYPPVSVWENFLPDLHRRIESEAALIFKKQQRQRLYLLPGWIASAVAILILFASVMLRYYPPANPDGPQRAGNIEMVESSFPSVTEDSSERAIFTVAGIISNVLITEAEAEELKKLESIAQLETLTLPNYYYDDVLMDIGDEVSGAGDDEGVIQYLENEFAEFGESPMIEPDDSEFGTM